MSIHILKDAGLFLAGYDFQSISNQVAVDDEIGLVEATSFGDAARRRLPGQRDVTMAAEGYVDLSSLDTVLNDRIGTVDEVMTVLPLDRAEGSPGLFFEAALGEYKRGGQVGEMFAFSISAEGSGGDGLIHGNILFAAITAAAAKTASGNGAGQNLGAVSAAQKLYAALHVVSASESDTLDVTVESEANDAWASPITQITFAQKTAIGSEYAAPKSGAIADTWYRIAYTIGGASPSFQFIVNVGIQ